MKKLIYICIGIIALLLLASCKEDEDHPLPTIEIENQVISISHDYDFAMFQILVDEEIVDQTDEKTYDLSTLNLNHKQIYDISVGVYDQAILYKSNSITITYDVELAPYTIVGHVISDQSVSVYPYVPLSITNDNDLPISEGDITIDGYFLIFDKDFLNNLDEDSRVFTVETEDGHFKMTFDILTSETPFVFNDDNLIYEGADLEILIYLGPYTEVSFSATNLTEDDYIYNEGYLVLNKSYVDQFILDYPTAQYLIVLATFTDEDSNNYYISIFIQLNAS